MKQPKSTKDKITNPCNEDTNKISESSGMNLSTKPDLLKCLGSQGDSQNMDIIIENINIKIGRILVNVGIVNKEGSYYLKKFNKEFSLKAHDLLIRKGEYTYFDGNKFYVYNTIDGKQLGSREPMPQKIKLKK